MTIISVAWMSRIPGLAEAAAALWVCALLWLVWNWRVRKRRLKSAVNWPKVEGRVWSIEMAPRSISGDDSKGYDVEFTYNFSLESNRKLDYHSGDFGRFFEEEEAATAWMEFYREKSIPVRVQPGNPNVSAVLDEDLDAL